jgi:hypothetical protein
VRAGRVNPHLIGNLGIVRGHEMRENESLDAGCLRHAAGIFCRCLVSDDARLEGCRVWHASHETIDCGHVKHGVHKYVGTRGKFHQVIRPRRVAGNDDRTVGAIETLGERRNHGWMMHKCRRHPHVFIAHHRTAVTQLVDMNQRNQREPDLYA